MIYEILQCCLLIWVSGMLFVGLHYLKKWKKYRWICRKNIPFHGDEYRAVLQKLYPRKNWKKVRFCTNYTIDSPCVMGVFHHVIVFKALNYPMKDIELVLMHEGTHIVRRDNLGKKLALLIVLVNWFNPILRLYLDDLDAWGDISCDIHVCSHFLGGHARKYFDLLLRFSQEENRSEQLPAFVSQLNSEQSLGKRVEYMIRWQKAGKKTGVSVILALALVIGSSVTAFASSTQVVEQQNDMYRETRVQEADISDADDLEEYVIPADQVDEEKWDNAIVYDDELLDPLSVQKNFDWKIPGNNFVRSGAFIKKAGSTIVVSCYVYDDRYHHIPRGTLVGICGGRLCNDVVYDGSWVCEAFQFVEECGVAASDHVRYLRVMGSGNRMEGMVGKYRNPEYLPIDPDCNADHIPNTVIITKRVYDILCNGVGIFDDTAVCTAHDRGDPLQNSVCHLYRL